MNKFKQQIILILIIVVLCINTIFTIKSCQQYKEQNNQNLIALTDTIKYYTTKNGETYVSKEILVGDLNTLKLVNDSLFKVIKEMKLKKPTSVVYIESQIDNGKKDTIWHISDPIYIVKHDTLYENVDLTKEFNFNNEYRELEGNILLKDSTLSLNIDKDKVFFDYILAVEDNKVYVKSNNPYIKYNEIQGIELPKQKKSIWGIVVGPSIGYGYDFNGKKFGPNIGINATIGIKIK